MAIVFIAISALCCMLIGCFVMIAKRVIEINREENEEK